jgi:GT2 family glycosyltransferase
MYKAAIVILNFNGRKTLEQFLPSVLQLSTYTVYVADNGSEDDSVDWLKQQQAIKVLQLDQNYGFAKGYNLALEQLKGKYDFFILLNSDVEVTPEWDINLITHLIEHGFTAVQPKILSFGKKSFFDHAGAAGGYLDSLGFPYCRGRIFEVVEPDLGQYQDNVEVDWVSGACMVVKAEDYFSFGGFDPIFFAHMEEIDLCWRWRRAGKKLAYFSGSTVYHLGGGTLPKTNPKKTYLNFRNNLLMLYKNLSKKQFRKIYGIRIITDGTALLAMSLKGQLKNAGAIYQAHSDFWKMSQNAGYTPLASKLPMEESVHKISSIIYLHYVKRIRKFTDL